jgi:glycosyltransferase involved in cell wall biosynthesis
LVKQQNFDVIHCNTRVTQLLGFLLYRRFAIPYIAAYHGFYRSSLARKKIKLSGLRSIAVSKAVKDHLVKDLAIEAEKIRVVYNGIDSDEFLAREGRKNDRGFKDSDFLIGILGRISEEKGHFLAVDALSELISRYPNVYLLISGKGRLESKLKAYIDDKGLEKRVRFLECSANNFLDIIDLLTMPSRKEGFGYSILEAFIKGVPVVGYNTGGIAEIIRDRENGCLFYRHNSSGLAEAIEEVMVNASLRDKIIKHGRQDVLKFSTVQMAMATEKVYREVCR